LVNNFCKTHIRYLMAVVVANLMDYNVKSYAGLAPFTDVPAWAEAYVSACYSNGIVSGASATEYNGEAAVNATEAGLMVMKALGYFQYASDFGTDWEMAVAAKGAEIGLYDGLSVGLRTQLTRNDVAQLVLNALESVVVIGYQDGTSASITAPGVSVEISAKVDYVEQENDIYYDGDETDEYEYLVEKLFEDELTKGDDEDKYGRPGYAWFDEDDDVIVFVADKALATYAAGDMDEDTLTDDFDPDKDWNSEDTFSVIYNGSTHAETLDWFYGANGVAIEVYGDKDDKVIETVIAIEAYFAEVTEVITDEDDEVESMEISVYLPTTEGTLDIVVEDDEDAYELVKGYEEEDFLMVTVAQGWHVDGVDADDYLLAVADVETVKGEVTATYLDAGNNGWIKVDGEKYEMAWVYAGDALSREDEGTFYLYNDFVIFADTTSEDPESALAIVMKAGDETTKWNETTYFAEILKMDGTIEEIEVSADATALVHDVVTFVYDDDDENYDLAQHDVTDLGAGTIEKGKTAITYSTDSSFATNGKTKYLVIELDDGEFDAATVYTGYKNVKSMDVTALVNTTYDDVQYVIAVYGSAVDADADDLIYVLGASKSTSIYDDADGEYNTYVALVKGEVVTIKVDADLTATTFNGLYDEATINDKGIYTALTAEDVESTTTAADIDFEKAADDVITIADVEYAYADDVALFVIDGDEMTKGSISKNYFDVTVTFTTNDEGEVDLIFVIK